MQEIMEARGSKNPTLEDNLRNPFYRTSSMSWINRHSNWRHIIIVECTQYTTKRSANTSIIDHGKIHRCRIPCLGREPRHTI